MGSPSSDGAPPYLGLSTYGEGDADLFFGRGAERDLVVANLLTSRLTVLYGPSGVGKSSLLRAGVLPGLRSGAGLPSGGSRRLVALVDAWRDDPVGSIAAAVAAAAGDSTSTARSGEAPLDETLAHYGAGGIVLILLDQFEDYFLYHGGSDDRLALELPRLVTAPDARARVLISLRADALSGLDRLEGSTAPLFGNLLRLGPMSDEAAMEAITKPAERGGPALEPGLPGRVLALLHAPEPRAGAAQGIGSADHTGVEPVYLQLVMRRLWDRESRRGSTVLTRATLDAMGSLRAIVSEHLSEAIDRLSAPERRRMAGAFRYLVTPSGAKIAQSRRDLAELSGERETALAEPLEKLAAGDARILRPLDDAPSYELFHDVLAQPVLDWQARFRAARLQRRAAALGMAAAAGAAIVLVLIAYILEPRWLEKVELATVDARFAIRGAVEPGREIVIVDLDDESLAALGEGRARVPRRVHARMIDVLRAAGPTVIAYDFEFRVPAPGDASLRRAIERAGPQLLLAATRIDSDGRGQVLGRSGGELAASVGYAGFPIAADGAYRQVDRSVGLSGAERAESEANRLASFAVVAAGLAGEPPGRFDRAWIDFHGPARTFATERFADVLRGGDPGRLAGKIVVVGTSARAQGDLHPTAGSGGRVMSGAEIQANAISTMLRGRPLGAPGAGVDVLLIVLFGLVPPAFAILTRASVAAALVALMTLAYVVIGQLLFSAGVIVPVIDPLLSLLLSTGFVFAVRAGIARGRSGPLTG